MSQFLTYSCRWKCTKLINSPILAIQSRRGLIRPNPNKSFSQKVVAVNRETADENGQFIPFLDRVNLRRAEARRSLIVQVQSAQSYKELHSYCSLFGNVKKMLHYSNGLEPLHFILVEFVKESEVSDIIDRSTYLENIPGVPANSHYLWFRATKKQQRLKHSKTFSLAIEDGTRILSDEELKDELSKCNNVSQQMQLLHTLTALNDIGTRLRFLTALQIENMISGIFPYAVAYPFGSSVNGYGKIGCDLDLVLRLLEKPTNANKDSRLIFHCKALTGTERTMGQRQMEVLGDMIHLFLPGCAQVRRILQARVPIIKYHQQLTDVECDLSMTNMSGVYMSDFLYLMGEIDPRVRPLVFSVRKWACAVSLTNSSPGRWITNFSLTLLVLSFLQRPLSGKAILPSLNTLVKLAGPKDKYVTEDGINCSFLRDLANYKEKTENKDTLESLLKEFFEYYSQFDFSNKAVCLNEAVTLTKPEYSPMYIVNPLERGLNVSKNVSSEEVERFQNEAKNAAWLLESQESRTSGVWGLLSIMESKTVPKVKRLYNNVKQDRLVEVSTLFQAEDTEYKNDAVKREISKIQKSTREKLKELKNNIHQRTTNR